MRIKCLVLIKRRGIIGKTSLTRHVGGDGHRARQPGLGDDLALYAHLGGGEGQVLQEMLGTCWVPAGEMLGKCWGDIAVDKMPTDIHPNTEQLYCGCVSHLFRLRIEHLYRLEPIRVQFGIRVPPEGRKYRLAFPHTCGTDQ